MQNELLQLHLLHQSSFQIRREWEEDARRKLEIRFNEVAGRDRELSAREREELSMINAHAFARWKDVGVPGIGLDEKVRILDEALSDIWTMSDEKSGRYTRLVRTFEKFLGQVKDVLEYRERDDHRHDLNAELLDDEVIFIDPLPREWKEAAFHVERKLKSCQEALESLGNADPTTREESHGNASRSTLSRALHNLSNIVDGMLEELNVMVTLEDEIVRREKEWIEKMNREESDADGVQDFVAGAIWRRRV